MHDETNEQLPQPEIDEHTREQINLFSESVLEHVHLSPLYILGIEITQAIQSFRSFEHLTDPSSDHVHSARLVAGKPAWVRVYVRSTAVAHLPFGRSIFLPPFSIDNVTGSLEISRRRTGSSFYIVIANLKPQPPGKVTASTHTRVNYAAERETLEATLNFIIPGHFVCGHMRLRANISSPTGASDTLYYHADATLEQELHIRGIMIGYHGPRNSRPGSPIVTLDEPVFSDLLRTSAFTQLAFPISGVSLGHAGVILWDRPVDDFYLTGWSALLERLQMEANNDGNRAGVIYYGLLHKDMDLRTAAATGVSRGNVAAGPSEGGTPNFGPGVMAHESGHVLGLVHTPDGIPVADADPNYPAYRPYDTGSIGEYGFDISNGDILPPNMFKDIMSGAGIRWVSLYTYGRLFGRSLLHPNYERCGDRFPPFLKDPLISPRPEPVISIIGTVHSQNKVEIKSVMRLDANPKVENGLVTKLVAKLMGTEGVLAQAPVYCLLSYTHNRHKYEDLGHSQEERYPYAFQAFVLDKAPGTMLGIYRDEQVIWTRKASDKEPRVYGLKASIKENDLDIEWKFESSGEQEVDFWLQWSNDGGKTWNGLTSGLNIPHATIDISTILPPGKSQIRVLVSDGFYTDVCEPVTVIVRDYGPKISILTPCDGQTLVSGRPMRLWGAIANGAEKTELKFDVTWLLDNKEVARELDAFITTPQAGKHQLTLSVKVGDQSAKTSATFISVNLTEEDIKDQE